VLLFIGADSLDEKKKKFSSIVGGVFLVAAVFVAVTWIEGGCCDWFLCVRLTPSWHCGACHRRRRRQSETCLVPWSQQQHTHWRTVLTGFRCKCRRPRRRELEGRCTLLSSWCRFRLRSRRELVSYPSRTKRCGWTAYFRRWTRQQAQMAKSSTCCV